MLTAGRLSVMTRRPKEYWVILDSPLEAHQTEFCHFCANRTDWEVGIVSICFKDELVFLWLCLSTMQHQAIEHSQWMGWWLTTTMPEWLCYHVSTTGLGIISSGPWELSHNDNIRLVCLSLKSECLAIHFMEKGHGSILYTLQVVEITLYSLGILCWTGRNNRGFENNSPDTIIIFKPLCYFFMNLWIMQKPYTWRPLTMIP